MKDIHNPELEYRIYLENQNEGESFSDSFKRIVREIKEKYSPFEVEFVDIFPLSVGGWDSYLGENTARNLTQLKFGYWTRRETK